MFIFALAMKQLLHKIFSTVLSLIILLSTFSFTVDKHYCGDFLVNTSLFTKAEGCGMDMQKTVSEDGCETIKKNCCKNETTYIEANTIEQQALDKQVVEQVFFVAIFVKSYVSLFEEKVSDEFTFHFYKPPLIQKDIRVLFENFRI